MLSEAQRKWLSENDGYMTCGPPRPGVRFADCGTLYADGSFIESKPLKTIVLKPGCVLVGRRRAALGETANPVSKNSKVEG